MTRSFSLRTLLLVPLVLQLAATAAIITVVSFQGRQQAADVLATRIQQRASRQLRDHLRSYLQTPQQVIRLMAEEVASGRIDPADRDGLRRYLWMLRHTFADAAYLNYGWANGDFIGLGQVSNSSSEPFLEVARAATIARLEQIRLDASGQPAGLERIKPFADFRSDAWYRDPQQAGRPVWTPIYNWVDAPEVMAMGAGMPIWRQGRLVGVAGVDVFLANISRYLRDLPITDSGEIYIVEPDGALVAASSDRLPFSIIDGRGVRHRAQDAREPMIRETARALLRSSSNFGALQQPRQLRLRVNGANALVRVEPFRDAQGLDWRIVVVIPESDVDGDLRREAIERLLISLVAILISGTIALLVVEFVIRRLDHLVRGADAMAEGDLRQVVEPEPIREVARLATSLNTLAFRLQRSLFTLRMRNREVVRLASQRSDALAESERRLQEEVRLREQLERRLDQQDQPSSVPTLPVDPLTGLFSRLGLERQLAGASGADPSLGPQPVVLLELAVAPSPSPRLAAASAALDDLSLLRIAGLLEEEVARHHGLAARLDRCRFALLLRGLALEQVRQRIAALAAQLQPGMVSWAGIAVLEPDPPSGAWERLLVRADRALQRALVQAPASPGPQPSPEGGLMAVVMAEP